jgi:hypothetical protein
MNARWQSEVRARDLSTRGKGHVMVKKRMALVAILAIAYVVGTAFGAGYDPCYGAYLESGLNQQQMTFQQFRQSYGDTLCAPDGLKATHEPRIVGEMT